MKNIIYYKVLYEIGGTESYLFYLCKKYKDRDIEVFYRDGDLKQIERLRKYVKVTKYVGQEIECEKAFFNYHYDIIEHVHAKEYIQVLHTDYSKQNVSFVRCPMITKYLGASEAVAENFTKMTGLPCECAYNPIIMDKPKRLLRLISATRLSAEKGWARMIQLSEALDKVDIPYQWTIFTNDINKARIEELGNPNMIYMPTRLDITPFIASSHYLVQLSNNGEGFGYTPCEALCLGVPVIVTPCDSFKELGIVDGENGYVLDFDMEHIDVNKIYKKRPKFEYTPPKDRYDELLAKGKSTYVYDDSMVLVRCIDTYDDMVIGERITPDSMPYMVEKGRADMLESMGYIRRI